MSRPPAHSPAIVELYEQYLVDHELARYLRRVTARYHTATLERLAEWGERPARRGAVLALGDLGDYSSNPTVGRALIDDDRGVRILAEEAIQKLWCRTGTPAQQELLHSLVRLNESQQYAECIRRATEVLHDSPWLAESWNQRGTAHFYLAEFEDSIRDCHQALEINPYHFSAATRMGKSFLQLGDRVAALESFRRALRLNPSLEDVRAHVTFLRRALKEEG